MPTNADRFAKAIIGTAAKGTDPVTGLPDKFFRKLTPAEEAQFRQWTRDNWKPDTKPEDVWHPVVRDEWRKIDAEQKGKNDGQS